MRKCKLIQLFWYSKFLILMRRTTTPHLAEKAFSLIGPFMKERRSSIIICHITSFKRVLVGYTINHISVVFKRRTIKHKHTGRICWGQLLCIIRLKNWAMSGLQSGKKFTALFLHSALSKYNWSSNTSCGYSIKMLSKYWLVRHKHLVIGTPCNPKRNPTGNRMIFSVASIGLSHSNKLNSGNVCSQVL